jgi:hypothetical protein
MYFRNGKYWRWVKNGAVSRSTPNAGKKPSL